MADNVPSRNTVFYMMIIDTILLYLLSPCHAYAYIDPGTGTYVFQLLIAGVLGGLFAVKMKWQKIKSFFKNLFSSETKGKNDES